MVLNYRLVGCPCHFSAGTFVYEISQPNSSEYLWINLVHLRKYNRINTFKIRSLTPNKKRRINRRGFRISVPCSPSACDSIRWSAYIISLTPRRITILDPSAFSRRIQNWISLLNDKAYILFIFLYQENLYKESRSWCCHDESSSITGAHKICLCSRLLFYSKCTGFTVCFTYSDISLTMDINQW